MNDTSNIVTLTGREPITVLVNGVAETVYVRTFPIREFSAYLTAQENELAMVAMLCAMPVEWAEKLDNASIEAVLAKGEEMNRDFFVRWVNRRLNRQE